MSKPNKICRVVPIGGVDTRQDGKVWPKTRYIYADPAVAPNEAWLWDGPDPDAPPPPPQLPPVQPADMTDAQIAADPLFPLVARVIKERRKSGPTSKRPKDLTVDDRGFCYWNTDRKAPEYWHITGKWFDAMGIPLP